MKTVKFLTVVFLITATMTSCVTINYPQSGIAEIETSPKEPEETSELTDTLPISETEETLTEEVSVTDGETEKTPNPESESDAAVTTDSPKETEDPEETSENLQDGDIRLISLTSPISPNRTATIDVKGKPNTEYDISVVYSTSESTAKGLENKVSDSYGFVSWSWKIGPSVKTGRYRIKITGGNSVFETYIQVD